jgi:type 2 lantibiotic biosynthesis protein LanM
MPAFGQSELERPNYIFIHVQRTVALLQKTREFRALFGILTLYVNRERLLARKIEPSMKKLLSQNDKDGSAPAWSARWYLATTLSERARIPFQRRTTTSPDAATPGSREKARQRLAQWKSQSPFQNADESFAQRLALDGLTEESFLTLLAQPEEALQAAFPAPPEWLVEIFRAFEMQDASILASLPLEHLDDPQTNAIFQTIRPLLAQGFARLQVGIAELQKNHPRLPFDPQTIGLLLFPHILGQLLSKMTKTLVLELNVARIQERLEGETSEERYLYFLRQLAQPANMLNFLEEYPVLARYLVERIAHWTTCELELLQRLCNDWDELRLLFAPTSEPGVLSEIQEGAGDLHQGGHSVSILTWSSGLRLVYKPRSLATDSHFQALLAWLNSHGCRPTFRLLKLLPKETYGWCEFISADECTSTAAIERFYQRLGGYLALLYSLEAIDFHAQNLIAAGDYPVLVDLEALFHPRVDTRYGSGNAGRERISHSVLRVGLLPQRIWSNEKGESIDLSGLAGKSGQLTPFPVATWKAQGTDQMHLAKERVEFQLGDHRPALRGQEIDTLEYEKDIIKGFKTVYQLLLRYRNELLEEILPLFKHDEIRVLLRPTQHYVHLEAESFHPNVLRDALERDRIFDRLWIGVAQKPALAHVIAAESADLLGSDIPKFTTRPESLDLFNARGEIIENFFQQSSLELTRTCIQRLDEQDLERQLWVIQASFTSLALNTHTSSRKRRSLQLLPTQSEVTRERLVAQGEAIGNRLQKLALIQENTANWLGVTLVNGQDWQPLPASLDLYNGLPGISLFLAYLGHVTKNADYTHLAHLALQSIQAELAFRQHYLHQMRIGAFDGSGSLIYLLAHLGTLWHEPMLYQEAENSIVKLSDAMNKDEFFDVMNGAAGCIAALLSLYAVAPSPTTLAAAVQCGDHLLKHATSMQQGIAWTTKHLSVPLAGMSHGNAGIALNLLRLAAVSKQVRFQQAALEAMEYERSLFSADQRNWPDLRNAATGIATENAQDGQDFMVAWCHGATGIGLARLEGLQYQDDAATREEIDAAIQTTLDQGFGRNHSLCHGDLGNLECLLMATQVLPDRYTRQNLETLQASLLDSIDNQGWQSGAPMGVETPGLMLGLAGIGYALLRQADPEQVPSLLLLAPPTQSHQ